MSKKIAVIGLGVSGSAVLLALSRLPKDTLTHYEMACFDETKYIGHGIPFQEDSDLALINSPIDDISFDYHDMSDFEKWLEHKKWKKMSPYVPRSIYGDYMKESLTNLQSQLSMKVIEQKVEAIEYLADEKQWLLTVPDGQGKQIFDEVHFACGALPPIDPYELEGREGYIADPYPLDQMLTNMKSKERLAVIGTGLAAVDVLKWLISHSNATIHVFSRSNYFPTVRSMHEVAVEFRIMTQERLEKRLLQMDKPFEMDEFQELFHAELKALGLGEWDQLLEGYLVAGFEGVEASIQHPERFYLLQKLASHVSDWFTDLWPLMPAKDRKVYKENYHKWIVNLRNPMPYDSARFLLDAVKSGRLTIINDVEELVKSSADFVMKGKDGQSISVNGVVNATGYQLNSDNQQKADPILKSLLYQELAQISSEGGLTIDPQSMRVISPKYGILPTLYAHGSLVNGSVYQNNSTIKIQKMAEKAIL